MDSGAKGERYSRIFRKAGVYLAKGNVARALEVLKEGRDLAEQRGPSKNGAPVHGRDGTRQSTHGYRKGISEEISALRGFRRLL